MAMINDLFFNNYFNVLLSIVEIALLVSILITETKMFTSKIENSSDININDNDNDNENHCSEDMLLRGISNEVQQVLKQLGDIVECELSRIAALVKDGSDVMLTSFMDLQALNQEQQQLIATLMRTVDKTNISSLKLVDEIAFLTPKIDKAVGAGVRSLQFEDITFQTITNLKNELNTINLITEQFQRLNKISSIKETNTLLEIKNNIQQIKEKVICKNQARTVTQSTIDEGEIELF
jgi:methyl-accepting chemotaxis protein